ncbi:hypothetical protein H4R34_004607, partial [Dimargaris verticillata]
MDKPRGPVTRGVPDENSVTIAEIDGSLVSLKSATDEHAQRYVRAGGANYPHIVVPTTLPRAASDLTGAAPGKRSTSTPGFKIFKAPSQRPGASFTDYASEQVMHWWQVKDELMRTLEHWKETYINGYLSYLRPKTTFLDCPSDAIPGPVRQLAWHPYKQVFALGHAEDVVFIYDLNRESWFSSCLVHPFQTSMRALAWKPNSGTTLATACRNGICVWRIRMDQPVYQPPKSGERKVTPPPFAFTAEPLPTTRSPHHQATTTVASGGPSTTIHTGNAWLDFLQFPGFTEVSCIAWDPTGQYLAAGSASQGTILIWDTVVGVATPLRRVAGSTISLAWSPDGMYLCSTHTNKQFRLWETSEWRSMCWSQLPSFPTQAVWTPDSRCVYFALHERSDLYNAVLMKPAPSLDAQVGCIQTFSPQRVLADNRTMFEVGGFIHHLALDPTGKRLVVGFVPPDRALAFEHQQDNQSRPQPIVRAPELLAVLTIKNRLV